MWRPALVLIIVLGYAVDLHAAAVGSPASVLKKGQWMMGLRGGGLVDRALKAPAEATIVKVSHFRGYGVTDWLSVYGQVGGGYLQTDDSTIIKKDDSSTTHRFGTNVLLGGGLKARVWRHAGTGLEWDGSIQFEHLRAERKGKNEGRWNEWQFASGLARPFGRVKPYAGVMVSLVEFKFRARQDGDLLKQDTCEEDGMVGLYVGSDVYFGQHEDVVLNVESAFVDGAEVTAALSYIF